MLLGEEQPLVRQCQKVVLETVQKNRLSGKEIDTARARGGCVSDVVVCGWLLPLGSCGRCGGEAGEVTFLMPFNLVATRSAKQKHVDDSELLEPIMMTSLETSV